MIERYATSTLRTLAVMYTLYIKYYLKYEYYPNQIQILSKPNSLDEMQKNKAFKIAIILMKSAKKPICDAGAYLSVRD